jgi:hypothetical protein
VLPAHVSLAVQGEVVLGKGQPLKFRASCTPSSPALACSTFSHLSLPPEPRLSPPSRSSPTIRATLLAFLILDNDVTCLVRVLVALRTLNVRLSIKVASDRTLPGHTTPCLLYLQLNHSSGRPQVVGESRTVLRSEKQPSRVQRFSRLRSTRSLSPCTRRSSDGWRVARRALICPFSSRYHYILSTVNPLHVEMMAPSKHGRAWPGVLAGSGRSSHRLYTSVDGACGARSFLATCKSCFCRPHYHPLGRRQLRPDLDSHIPHRRI